MGEIVFHVPELWLGAAPEKMPRFYRRLSEGLAARGIAQPRHFSGRRRLATAPR